MDAAYQVSQKLAHLFETTGKSHLQNIANPVKLLHAFSH
jgi:hypothetical protein